MGVGAGVGVEAGMRLEVGVGVGLSDARPAEPWAGSATSRAPIAPRPMTRTAQRGTVGDGRASEAELACR